MATIYEYCPTSFTFVEVVLFSFINVRPTLILIKYNRVRTADSATHLTIHELCLSFRHFKPGKYCLGLADFAP